MEDNIFGVGCYYIDSFCRPMKCTEYDEDGGHITGESLVHHLKEGRLGWEDQTLINEWYEMDEFAELCDETKAIELKEVWERDGERGAMIFLGYDKNETDKFLSEWRNKTPK